MSDFHIWVHDMLVESGYNPEWVSVKNAITYNQAGLIALYSYVIGEGDYISDTEIAAADFKAAFAVMFDNYMAYAAFNMP